MATKAAVRAVATFGLEDVGLAETFTVADEEWEEFGIQVRNHRLGGLAVAAIDGGMLGLREYQVAELVDRHREDMHHCLRLEQKLLEIAYAFEDAEVEFVVLKGPALAHTMYPNPSWRPFADIDLLVRTSQWREACGVLVGMGCVRRLPEPRPGFDERFGKAAVHVTSERHEIDLHRTLALGPFGLWIRADELFDRTAKFAIGGRQLRRLDDTSLLLHACIHAALGQRKPSGQQLRDVRQLLDAGGLNAEALVGMALRWNLAPVVGRALMLEAGVIGGTYPTALRRFLTDSPSSSEQRLLDAYTTGRRGRGGVALATFKAISRPRDKLAYMAIMIAPTQDFLRARTSGSKAARLRRLITPARWLVGRLGKS